MDCSSAIFQQNVIVRKFLEFYIDGIEYCEIYQTRTFIIYVIKKGKESKDTIIVWEMFDDFWWKKSTEDNKQKHSHGTVACKILYDWR